MSCAEGDAGFVYEGRGAFDVEHIDLSALRRPRTKIMMNVGNPDEAFALSFIPNDGVGLARIEFIINTAIGVHPMALVRYDAARPGRSSATIDRLTPGYTDKPAFFVDKLAEGVGTIAAAFYPKDVIVRLSDFKTNEYARLVGRRRLRAGRREPDDRLPRRLALLRRALPRGLRAGMPRARSACARRWGSPTSRSWCRSAGRSTRRGACCRSSRANGLERGENGLELYMMVEIPSNVILLPEFAEYFDGFSIGSNDLTQLTLGVDRDSEIVAHVFDERDAAVQTLIAQAIAHARGSAARSACAARRRATTRSSPVPRRVRHRQHVAQPGCRASDDAPGCRGRTSRVRLRLHNWRKPP